MNQSFWIDESSAVLLAFQAARLPSHRMLREGRRLEPFHIGLPNNLSVLHLDMPEQLRVVKSFAEPDLHKFFQRLECGFRIGGG
jgi:hypothetical protein